MQFQVKTNNPTNGRLYAMVSKTAMDLQGARTTSLPLREDRKQSEGKSSKERPKKDTDVECFHCGEKGHIKWKCPKFKEERKRGDEKAGAKGKGKDVGVLQEEVGKAIFVDVELGAMRSVQVRAQVDTGASSTAIDRELAEELSP